VDRNDAFLNSPHSKGGISADHRPGLRQFGGVQGGDAGSQGQEAAFYTKKWFQANVQGRFIT
jgi:hypothetical protein